MTKYNKEFKDYSELADLAISRGLEVPSRDVLISVLRRISYYRFSGYLFPFKQDKSDSYLPNTTIDKVIQRYSFDDKLRKITFNAFTEIEIQLRNDIVHEHARLNGPFGYLYHQLLPNMLHHEHDNLVASVSKNKVRSTERFIVKFRARYKNHDLPLWMAIETLTFGELLYLHKGLHGDIHALLAEKYQLKKKIFRSWIISLGYIRNICTHHGRLWDKSLSLKPRRSDKYIEWKESGLVNTSTFYAITLVLLHFQRHIPSIQWKEDFLSLAKEHSSIPYYERMGFPKNWQDFPIWQV